MSGLSLPGLGWRRLASQRGLAAALALGLAASVALAAAVPLVQAVAAEAGLRSMLQGLGDRSTVTVEQFNTGDVGKFESFQQEAGARVQAALGTHVRPGAQFATI